MAESSRCPKCGGEFPADAPQGLCPQCLLKVGLETREGPLPESEPAPTTRPGPRFVPPTIDELAPHFPQLEILELLGQGGMGAVYKARQPGLDRLVALKVLPREVGGDPAFSERFTREARALAKLIHPHIVAVYDFGQTPITPLAPEGRGAGGEGQLYYFVMEYVDGVNLREMLAAGHLQPREALAIVPQICEALQFAHDEGIVHRDVKPENVLVDRKGRVKMADFGLAKLLGIPAGPKTLTRTGQVMGTPHYMAPEQIEHPHDIDHRADIYALGVVFYEMLTGELPLGRFEPPSHKVRIDVRLDEVVLRTLEKEPERRYQHASQVQTDVEAIARGPAPPPLSPAPAPPPTQAGLEAARAQVTGPAIGLIVTGALHLAALLLLVVLLVPPALRARRHASQMSRGGVSDTGSPGALAPGKEDIRIVARSEPGTEPEWVSVEVGSQSSNWAMILVPGLFILLLTVGVLPGLVILVGAVKMMRLSSYRWATAASIVALLPTPIWLLGLAMGIWSLAVLSRPEVKAAFAAQAAGAQRVGLSGAKPQGGSWLGCLVAAILVLLAVPAGLLGLALLYRFAAGPNPPLRPVPQAAEKWQVRAPGSSDEPASVLPAPEKLPQKEPAGQKSPETEPTQTKSPEREPPGKAPSVPR